MINSYSILVNTCDKFEDCWDPFFKLWSIYWSDYNGNIYLNTEYKDYHQEGLSILSLKVCEKHGIPINKKISWSQCLKWALENIDTEIVLYMQDDYFLKEKVKNEIIENFVHLMTINEDIHCIYLTDQGPTAGNNSKFENLNVVPKKHKDRISCQAALWKKDVLLEYILTYESGWNFEWWGSKRAAILNHNFFVVNQDWVKLNHFEIIPYIFTGIIGGKWFKEVIPLFEKHEIKIDYKKRAFYSPQKKSLTEKIVRKFRRLPLEIRSYWNLIILRITYL